MLPMLSCYTNSGDGVFPAEEGGESSLHPSRAPTLLALFRHTPPRSLLALFRHTPPRSLLSLGPQSSTDADRP